MTELVTAYRLTGRMDDALALAQEGLRLEPNFRSLREELGWIHLQRGGYSCPASPVGVGATDRLPY